MEWLEAVPLPPRCQHCKELDCHNCDYAGERWLLSREDELKLQLKSLHKAIERLQRKVQVIESELNLINRE